MRAELSLTSRILSRNRFWPVLVLVIFCAGGIGEVRAASVSTPSLAAFDLEAHARECRCGKKCQGASCCCGKRQSRPSASTPASRSTRFEANPCQWTTTPCGDPIAPVTTRIGTIAKAATLASVATAPVRDDGQELVVATPLLFTDRRANRLDRPPRFMD